MIQRVEVDAADVVVEQVAALFCGPVDTDAFYGFRIASGACDGALQFGGIAAPSASSGMRYKFPATSRA